MNWNRIAIGVGILIAASYIIRLFGGNTLIDLAFILLIVPITSIYMFSGDTDCVVETDGEES